MQKLTFPFSIGFIFPIVKSCDDIYDSSASKQRNGTEEEKPGAIRSRFIVVRGDRLTNNNPGDSALTSSRKIRSEATLYCSRNCMQRHSFRLGTRVHRA